MNKSQPTRVHKDTRPVDKGFMSSPTAPKDESRSMTTRCQPLVSNFRIIWTVFFLVKIHKTICDYICRTHNQLLHRTMSPPPRPKKKDEDCQNPVPIKRKEKNPLCGTCRVRGQQNVVPRTIKVNFEKYIVNCRTSVFCSDRRSQS